MVDHRSRPDTDEFPAVVGPVVPGGAGNLPAVSTGPVRNPKRATGFTLGALAVLLLIVIGAVAFMVAGTGSDAPSDGAAPAATQTQALSPNPDTNPAEAEVLEETPAPAPVEAPGTVTVTETPTEAPAKAARPTNPTLPSGHSPVNEAARSNTPAGDLNNVYTGTQTTSPDFALNVRDAFVRYYLDTGELNGKISAVSPITGLTYDITCQDNGGFVTCTGGDNAVIYIS